MADDVSLEGGCDCGELRYRMTRAPMIVHCCHCRWCQRESGASFALNAMVEATQLALLTGAPEAIDTPSESGKGQRIFRCPTCRLALWSHYAGPDDKVSFVRVGTLDDAERVPPDIHVFTASKQPWVVIPPDATAFEAFYKADEVWPEDSLARRRALFG